MIIDKEKIIFIHIPKNAGMSIKRFCFKQEKLKTLFKHKTIYDIKKENPVEYNTYRKFAVVRNPYDRMVSWFAYQKRYRLDNDLLNTYQHNSKTNSYEIVETVKAPVDEFRYWFKDKHADPQQDFDIFKPQHEWIDKTVTILKYENLNEELSNFLNEKIELPKVNNTSRFDIMSYYDKKTLDIVYERYKEDFEKFNYKKI